MNASVAEIARLVGGAILGDANAVITGVNSIHEARVGEITFLVDPRLRPLLDETHATAALVGAAISSAPTTLIQVANPQAAMAAVVSAFIPCAPPAAPGIHPSAIIDASAVVAADAAIGPQATIGPGAEIGSGAVVGPGACIGAEARIGADAVLHAHVIVRERVVVGDRCLIHSGAVIGSDGFGFAFDRGRHVKVPQIGIVLLEADVEVGSNTCIDRATFGETRIGEGTKIDNLVQIGHNCRIGKHCVISGMSGFGGSTILGDYVTVGANSGFAGHLAVGDRCVIAARSGVTKSIPSGAVVSGFPAIEHGKSQRALAASRNLPEALREMRSLAQRLSALEGQLHGEATNHSG